MAKYKVTSRAFDGNTGESILCLGKHKTREEEIGTESNELFSKVRKEKDVGRIYETFWNSNPLSPRIEVVKVSRLKR